MPLPTRSLPLLGAHAGRSARTCELKCGSACFSPVPNRSDNDYIGDVVTATVEVVELLEGRRRARLFCDCICDGHPVLEGEAWVAVPSREKRARA